MTRHAEWEADKANFLRLIKDMDPKADIPVAIRIDIPNHIARLMAPGVDDYHELRIACSQWVENWLAPEVDRMQAHLAWKATQ